MKSSVSLKRKKPDESGGTPGGKTMKKQKTQEAALQLGSLDVELEFAKKLAANEKLLRDRAMRNLHRWLRSQCDSGRKFTKSELMVMWKGLYYCLWMADKPIIQEELADNMVGLIKCFQSHKLSALNFMDIFFVTMTREYARLDRFRLDKFLMLTRRMFRGALHWLQGTGWSDKWVKKWLSCLRQHVLSGDSSRCPQGLQNFLLEVFLPELEQTVQDEEKPPVTAVFLVFCDFLLDANTLFLRNAVQKSVLKEAYNHSAISARLERKKLAEYALEQGKNPHCPVKNRRALYAVYTHFLKPRPPAEAAE